MLVFPNMKKNSRSALWILFAFLSTAPTFAQYAVSPAWSKILSSLPTDVQGLIRSQLRCQEMGGDQRSKEEAKVEKNLRCDQFMPKDLPGMRKKYSKDAKVLEILNCVDHDYSGSMGNCPE
jgi:hypothetical protein